MVWCPQYRRKVLTGAVELRLKELIQEAAAELNVDIIEMEIMPDHVHLLMEVDPQFGIHRAVKAIKGKISRVLRSEFASLRSVPLDEQLYFFWENAWRSNYPQAAEYGLDPNDFETESEFLDVISVAEQEEIKRRFSKPPPAWRTSCADGKPYGVNLEYYKTEEGYNAALRKAKYGWRENCEDGFEYGLSLEDYETEEEYLTALKELKLVW